MVELQRRRWDRWRILDAAGKSASIAIIRSKIWNAPLRILDITPAFRDA
jgi:hypothetical protein